MTETSVGYSGTPLIKKLGVKAGMRVSFVNPPEGYASMLGPLPDGIEETADGPDMDFVQLFTCLRQELEMEFPRLKRLLKPNGMLWVSWPKRAAKIETDVTENVVRDIGLSNGLVDVKIAAVDEMWSGLKFVYRPKGRPKG